MKKLKDYTKEVNPEVVDFDKLYIENANAVVGNLNEQDGIECEKCKNRGFITFMDEQGYKFVKHCECFKKRQIVRSMAKSGLSKRYLNNTLESFEIRKSHHKVIKELANSYLKEATDEWFVVSGQVGSGKTHIAVAIVRELMARGHDVKYLNFAMDYRSLDKRKLSGLPEVQEKALKEFEALCNVEILFIDDFLKLFDDIAKVFDLIDYRYSNNLKTIITTEYDSDVMLQKDQAVTSRIKEMCGKYWIDISKDISKNERLNE